MKNWTIALLLLIILDSITTIYIGKEFNFVILYIMNVFNMTLKEVMTIRVFYLLPFVYMVHKFGYSKITFILYMVVYFFGVGVQFI